MFSLGGVLSFSKKTPPIQWYMNGLIVLQLSLDNKEFYQIGKEAIYSLSSLGIEVPPPPISTNYLFTQRP
jgi:hypothetical protein